MQRRSITFLLRSDGATTRSDRHEGKESQRSALAEGKEVEPAIQIGPDGIGGQTLQRNNVGTTRKRPPSSLKSKENEWRTVRARAKGKGGARSRRCSCRLSCSAVKGVRETNDWASGHALGSGKKGHQNLMAPHSSASRDSKCW